MTAFSRRSAMKMLGCSAIAGISLPAFHASRQAIAQTRPFTWAATGGTWGSTLKSVFLDTYQKKTPGFTATHSAQLESIASAKILASCGSAPYDVTNVPQSDAKLIHESSCMEAYDPSVVTGLGDIYAEAKEGNYYAPFCVMLFGMTWNTKEATKPTSMNDLLLSKYKGRVGIPAYGWYGMTWLHAYNQALGGTEDDISKGIAAVSELVRKNKAVIVENADHGTRLMENGEIVIMPYWNGRTVRMQEAKIPAAFEIVPGSVLVGSGFSILKGSPYTKAAQGFVQHSLEVDQQLAFAKWSKYPPSNKTIKLPPELESASIPGGALERTAKLDWGKINKYRADYLERWNKEVLGS